MSNIRAKMEDGVLWVSTVLLTEVLNKVKGGSGANRHSSVRTTVAVAIASKKILGDLQKGVMLPEGLVAGSEAARGSDIHWIPAGAVSSLPFQPFPRGSLKGGDKSFHRRSKEVQDARASLQEMVVTQARVLLEAEKSEAEAAEAKAQAEELLQIEERIRRELGTQVHTPALVAETPQRLEDKDDVAALEIIQQFARKAPKEQLLSAKASIDMALACRF
jgi:hypothetical protein